MDGLKATFSDDAEVWPGTAARELLARMQAHVEALNAVRAAEARRRECVLRERTIERSLDPIYKRLEGVIRSTYGENVRILARFGLSPAKTPGPKTVEAKKEMVVNAAATRAARGTKGKRRRR
jgi:hypothetical protein